MKVALIADFLIVSLFGMRVSDLNFFTVGTALMVLGALGWQKWRWAVLSLAKCLATEVFNPLRIHRIGMFAY